MPRIKITSLSFCEQRQQKWIVMSLKKKSLWSKKLGEVIEKLVDIVAFIRQEITEVFGTGRVTHDVKSSISSPKLGPAGLALHYTDFINQMDNIAYPGLLPYLLMLGTHCIVDYQQVLRMLCVVIFGNLIHKTRGAYQGFGWLRECSNSSTDFSKKTGGSGHIIPLRTL